MKKFLSLALIVVLAVSTFVVVTSAATTASYCAIDSACLVKSKTLPDGTVPTFKSAEGDYNGLLVGLPANAKYGDAFFQAKDNYSIKYFDKNGKQITDSGAHIGTTDVVKVYNSSDVEVAAYGLVTYGDADGDGVFDVIDAYIAALCLNGHIDFSDSPAVYESVKPRVDFDNSLVDILDYQQIVNDAVVGDKGDNKKGRKIPVDESIGFESIIYACDGKAKTAAINIPDSKFKSIASIKYNGSATAPSAPGIYSITADIPDGTDYLVTPGTRNLGFMIIAPKNGTGYTTIVDNANKKITIDITNANATGADLTGYINSWVNPSYNLSVSSKSVANSTELASAMSLKSYDYYKTTSNVIAITKKTITSTADTSNAMLGCYLPDDYTLWNNVNAEKTVPVSVNDGTNTLSYTISFRQNSEAVAELDRQLFYSKSNAVRGQRAVSPPDSKGVDEKVLFFTTNYKEVFAIGQRKTITETGQLENCIRTVAGAGKEHPTLLTSLGSTGLKTILIGDNDTIMFVASGTKAGLPAFSSNAQELYDKNMRRYSAITSDELKDAITSLNFTVLTEFTDLINNVLSGLNINISYTSKTDALIGQSGWCRYACADDVTGLRYTSDVYLEFANVASSDAHRTMKVIDVEGYNKRIGYLFYLVQYEPFRVKATLKAGYKLSVTDASGNAVPYDAENNWYIMPASDVTVTAVPQ